MTSLPERLRSLAHQQPWYSGLQEALNQAADELDRRAARIQRLTTGIAAMRLRGEMALRDEEQPPLDPETPGYTPEMKLKERAVRADHLATRMPIPGRDSDEEGSGEVGAGSDDPYVEDVTLTFSPGNWLVFAHPDGSVSMRRG